MRDFTKLDNKTLQSLGGAAVKPDISANNLPKKGFVAARMNKDNFWNLMFWLGMVLGIGITSVLDGYRYLPSITLWTTILGIPYLVKINSRVTFDKDNGLLSSEGRSLQASYPKNWGFIIVVAVVLTVLLGLILDKNARNLTESLSRILIFGTFFGVITLYFILKNCPVSILFSKHIWLIKSTNLQVYSYNESGNHESLTSPRNMYSNPVNSWYSGNIYHRK